MILYTLYKNSYIDIGELDSLANVHVHFVYVKPKK